MPTHGLAFSKTANKEDLKAFTTKDDINQLKTEIGELKSQVAEGFQEVKRHFDVVAENIHQDVASANKDHLSLIKDQKLPDHRERIQTLENESGAPAAPKYAT